MTTLQELALTAVASRGRRQGIALCLSGGGFRAALFHLGAVGRLHQLGLLSRVDTISSVSGGSIFAAFLADRWVRLGGRWPRAEDWRREIAVPFREFCSRDLRTLPFLLWCWCNWLWPRPRVAHLEWLYRRRLTKLHLRELPDRPRFVFCATDLTFGVNWVMSRDGAGDYQAGYLTSATEWPVARAVTASSCFPPLFGPLRVQAAPSDYDGGKYQGAQRDRILGRLDLSDGGVYDNMGLEPVWKDHAQVLISDCGAPFDFEVGRAPWRRLLRYTAVVTNQTRALRLRALFSDWRERHYGGAYWSIGSGAEGGAPGYSQVLTEAVLGAIRTDLDAFTEPEMSVLENHGYFAAAQALDRFGELAPTPSPAPVAPRPEWMDENAVRQALADSHKRLSLRRLWRTTFLRLH